MTGRHRRMRSWRSSSSARKTSPFPGRARPVSPIGTPAGASSAPRNRSRSASARASSQGEPGTAPSRPSSRKPMSPCRRLAAPPSGPSLSHLLPLGRAPLRYPFRRGDRRRTSGRGQRTRGILACPAPGHPWPSGALCNAVGGEGTVTSAARPRDPASPRRPIRKGTIGQTVPLLARHGFGTFLGGGRRRTGRAAATSSAFSSPRVQAPLWSSAFPPNPVPPPVRRRRGGGVGAPDASTIQYKKKL